ncbi:glutamate 5-kinase [Kordiimonas marina]|uniref:glutamate 5-kinase n=1 Tax=Kordiimonas marina TaxID=2872312 RepID=UPI001FF19B03|nr:glutamate 5-kinase [Kordiimonas marina]MCJ9427874.1 glutamate 5-kinase [Kordiimonas marina]
MSAHKDLLALQNARRLVIKIGSALLVDGETGRLRKKWLAAMAEDVADLMAAGTQVVLVSSGAVAMGLGALGFENRPSRLEEAQAAAAVGQIRLAQAYQSLFDVHDMVIAQLLLTISDLEDRPRYLNARNTVEALLDRGIVPVINENDTVATSELRFGDNDRLAARVAQMAGADALILLSDIDGLYDCDPRQNADANLIPLVEDITPEIEAMAGPTHATTAGTGGMITKIMAAKIALAGGSSMVIMNGGANHPMKRLFAGERATLFKAGTDALTVRKRWIRGMMAPKGFLRIDEGAVSALKRGASLLPAGVVGTDGAFDRGDLVAFVDAEGHVVGQGLISYGSHETERLQGHKMSEAEAILGYAGRSALVHRDDLVLL